jgi:hypothetical protein
MFKKQARKLADGEVLPDVKEWTITNLDERIEYNT